MTDKIHFAIVGGGIAGLTMAIALQKKGPNAQVYEAAPVIKPIGAGLTLAGNAVKALLELGIEEEILKAGKVLKTLYIKDQEGKILAQTDAEQLSAKFGVINNFSIHRADLHKILVNHLAPGTLTLGKTCEKVEQSSTGVTLHFADGTSVEAYYLIACDGVHSPIRKQLLPGTESRYAGYTCWRAVIDSRSLNISSDITSETWGSGSRFGIVPLSDDRLYWFACLNAKPKDILMQSYRVQDLLLYFNSFHEPVSDILKNTPNDKLIWSDIVDIKPIQKFAFGRIVLTGDAAHATTPNMGQGACMAIEDAAVLSNCLDQFELPQEAFRRFEQKRIKRTTKIVNTSRRIGTIAQWENPLLTKIRNAMVRMTPPSVTEKQMRFLTDIDFH